MSTKDSCIKKLLASCCCSSTACGAAQAYDIWKATEACGLAYLNESACWWALCAPVVHDYKLG